MASARLLLVDDDETVRTGLQEVLEAAEFEVAAASNVNEAMKLIASRPFDVLVSDLHMPGAGDGLTVASAMRHANPKAATILVSAFPDLTKAAAAILRQVDEVILKPVKVASVVDTIRQRLAQERTGPAPTAGEPVSAVLEREAAAIKEAWLAQMESAGSAGNGAASCRLTLEERCEHLPEALRDILFRMRYPRPLGSKGQFSMSALQHGARRRRQGIGAASLIEEARALQVALFQTIGKNMDRLDLEQLPGALMTIADEVTAQLGQELEGYENEQPVDRPWEFR